VAPESHLEANDEGSSRWTRARRATTCSCAADAGRGTAPSSKGPPCRRARTRRSCTPPA